MSLLRKSLLLPLLLSVPSLATALPDWVTTPPADTMMYIWGVGEGSNLERAEKDALKNIAGKLSTSISSQSESRATSRDRQVSRYFNENVQTRIRDIQLYDYRTTESVPHKGGFYTLVQMKRQSFIRNTQLKLEQTNAGLRSAAKDADRGSALKRALGYRALLPQIDEAVALALVLQSADPDFEATAALNEYRDIIDRATKLMGALKVHVKASGELQPVAEEFERFLAEADIATTGAGSADGVIELSGRVNQRELFGAKNVEVQLKVATKENDGTVLKRQSYPLSGSSVTSYDAALRSAALSLADMDREQLLSEIGLK